MKEFLQPLGDRVIFKNIDEEITSGGIYLPDISQERFLIGEAISVGAGLITVQGVLIPTKVHVGDRFLYQKNSAFEFSFDSEKLSIIRETEIYAIILKR